MTAADRVGRREILAALSAGLAMLCVAIVSGCHGISRSGAVGNGYRPDAKAPRPSREEVLSRMGPAADRVVSRYGLDRKKLLDSLKFSAQGNVWAFVRDERGRRGLGLREVTFLGRDYAAHGTLEVEDSLEESAEADGGKRWRRIRSKLYWGRYARMLAWVRQVVDYYQEPAPEVPGEVVESVLTVFDRNGRRVVRKETSPCVKSVHFSWDGTRCALYCLCGPGEEVWLEFWDMRGNVVGRADLASSAVSFVNSSGYEETVVVTSVGRNLEYRFDFGGNLVSTERPEYD